MPRVERMSLTTRIKSPDGMAYCAVAAGCCAQTFEVSAIPTRMARQFFLTEKIALLRRLADLMIAYSPQVPVDVCCPCHQTVIHLIRACNDHPYRFELRISSVLAVTLTVSKN